MKKLARHIELLLRENDCVILPGFGGFIAHDVPAYYVSEEGLYYPPSRSINFNADITMNDGMLAQSYMKSYQVDYARATYMVDMAIEELMDVLYEEGTVTLPRIGTITQDIHQSLQFAPIQSGIASPVHFGLNTFGIKELSQLKREEEPAKDTEHTITRTAKTISLHINREVLHRVVSTAAVFLLLLMIALPTGNHRPTDVASLVSAIQIKTMPTNLSEELDIPSTTEPESQPEEVVEETLPTVVATTEEMPVVEEPQPAIIEPQATVIEPQATAVEPVADVQPTKTYHIIVASLPNHRGADETLNQYIGMGYPGASLVERDNRVRISLVQFTDKDVANEYLKTLRQQEKFQNAWLLAVKM